MSENVFKRSSSVTSGSRSPTYNEAFCRGFHTPPAKFEAGIGNVNGGRDDGGGGRSDAISVVFVCLNPEREKKEGDEGVFFVFLFFVLLQR